MEVEAVRKELSASNARALLKDADVVVDAFDNAASRRLVQETVRETSPAASPAASLPGLLPACLHVGLSEDYCEVVWDENYRVPRDAGGDVCEYPLARNIVVLAVAVASEALVAHLLEGVKRDWCATLRDLRVGPLDPPATSPTA